MMFINEVLTSKDIFNILESIAPIDLAYDWDNVGNSIGNENKNIKKILLALDLIDDVVEEAINNDIDLIITHHPLIFKSINKINMSTNLGRRIINLIKNDICVYSAHTNLDISNFGTNDALFDVLNLKDKEHFFEEKNNFSLGRVGNLKNSMKLKDFLEIVKEKLNLDSVRYVGDIDKEIKRVGMCTGSGSSADMFKLAKEKNCDVYITGDIRYHEAQIAVEEDLILIDGTHYGTENLVMPYLKSFLEKKLKGKNIDITVSKVNGQVFKNF